MMLHKILSLKGISVLNKQQQIFVKGGSYPPGTCAFNSGNGYNGISGVDRATAIGGVIHNDSNWCCDSCCSVGWLGADEKESLGCFAAQQ